MPFVLDHNEAISEDYMDEDGNINFTSPQFKYMTIAEVGMVSEPITYALIDIDENPAPPPVVKPLSFFDRIFSKKMTAPTFPDLGYEQNKLYLLSFFSRQMLMNGYESFYCNYDGGSDESMAYFEYALDRNKNKISKSELFRNIVFDPYCIFLIRKTFTDFKEKEFDLAIFSNVLNNIAFEFSCMLFGGNYGAGEYSLYGSFTVDLKNKLVIDDASATRCNNLG